MIGSQPCCRGAGGPGRTWGGLHHQIWWLLWSPRHEDQGILPVTCGVQASWWAFLCLTPLLSVLICCLCASVSYRWHVGARDDGGSSFEKIQVLITLNCENWLLLLKRVWWALFLTLMFCVVILSVLILDEAHERTLYTDIAIGLLKKVTPAQSFTGTNERIHSQLFKFVLKQ